MGNVEASHDSVGYHSLPQVSWVDAMTYRQLLKSLERLTPMQLNQNVLVRHYQHRGYFEFYPERVAFEQIENVKPDKVLLEH